MACLCQYFVTSKNRNLLGLNASTSDMSLFATQSEQEIGEEKYNKQSTLTKLNEEVSATELAAAKAEIWVLKKNLSDSNISIENLENLVRTIILKQNELLSEMYELKHQNQALQDECRMQRDYQAMERNAMIRELHDIKTLLIERTRVLEETVECNTELTSALQDANEKIYMMGMKFLKLKSSRAKRDYGPISSGSNTELSNA